LLALYGNNERPRTIDVIGLNAGCMIAVACCLGRILFLIQENAELGRSLEHANETLEDTVDERTRELLEARDDIMRQKMFLRSVIDALPSFVISQAADGTVLLANKSASRLYGVPREQLEGGSYCVIAGATNPNAPAVIAEETRAL